MGMKRMNVPMRVVGVDVKGGGGKGGAAMPAVRLFGSKHPRWGEVRAYEERSD